MSKLLRLPGLIDIHVHLRDLGQEYKEDFYTGTLAALAGGVTTVFDMSNNQEPIFTYEKLMEKINALDKKAVCDWGLYFGTDGKNINQFEKVKDSVVGLKVYLNPTAGNLFIEDEDLVEKVFRTWPKYKVVVVHAEGKKLDLTLALCRKYENKLHITHISTRADLEKILDAKLKGLPISCDVTPHHLFLSKEQISDKDTSDACLRRQGVPKGLLRGGGIKNKFVNLKGFFKVKPPLANKEDQEFLWEHINNIDCIATDHAPHTIEEKKSKNPPSGMPGLETMLPLLLNAVNEERLTIEKVIRLTSNGPRKIFGIEEDENTYVDVDMEEEYIIRNENLLTKCKWSPFDGWRVKGKVRDVYIRGKKVFSDGKALVEPGFGENIIL